MMWVIDTNSRHLRTVAGLILAAAASLSVAVADGLTGTARADAPAAPLAPAGLVGPGQPPIDLSIARDPARRDPRALHALPAANRHDGRLPFATETIIRGLADDEPQEVEGVTTRVARTGPGDAPSIGAQRQRLPATSGGPHIREVTGPDRLRQTDPRGSADGSGPPVVDRFIRALPGETCARHASTASLTDTYWRIDSLMGEPIGATDNRREPHLVLYGGPEGRFRATVGCTRLTGDYTRDGDRLAFGAAAGTRMACPPPLEAAERSLRAVLAATRTVRRAGQIMVFEDADGQPIAAFTAVYLL